MLVHPHCHPADRTPPSQAHLGPEHEWLHAPIFLAVFVCAYHKRSSTRTQACLSVGISAKDTRGYMK